MTEKEFLEEFIEYCKRFGYGSAHDQRVVIQDFLFDIHQEYYEVEFVKIGYNCGFDEDGMPYHDLKCQGECIK